MPEDKRDFPDFFIWYVDADKHWASLIADIVRGASFRALDYNLLPPSYVEEALSAGAKMIVLFSSDYMRSERACREYNLVLEKDPSRLILLRVAEFGPYTDLVSYSRLRAIRHQARVALGFELSAALPDIHDYADAIVASPKKRFGQELEKANVASSVRSMAERQPSILARWGFGKKAESVDLSVFAPAEAAPDSDVLVQVFLHKPKDQKAEAAAIQTEPDTVAKPPCSLALELKHGQVVDIILQPGKLSAEPQKERVTWKGQTEAAPFVLPIPASAKIAATFCPQVTALVDGKPVGKVVFKVIVTQAPSQVETSHTGNYAKRYEEAFVSYSSKDRAKVLKRVQTWRAAGQRVFADILSLDPGDRWARKLYERIAECDVFYLCWSEAAKSSEWVLKEAEHALSCQKAAEDRDGFPTPDIIPVILSVPPPPPPISLAHIHFDDPIAHVMQTYEKR